MKVLSYWNVSSQLRVNFRKQNYLICCQSVLYEGLYTIFFASVEANVFSVCRQLLAKRSPKIFVPRSNVNIIL